MLELLDTIDRNIMLKRKTMTRTTSLRLGIKTMAEVVKRAGGMLLRWVVLFRQMVRLCHVHRTPSGAGKTDFRIKSTKDKSFRGMAVVLLFTWCKLQHLSNHPPLRSRLPPSSHRLLEQLQPPSRPLLPQLLHLRKHLNPELIPGRERTI